MSPGGTTVSKPVPPSSGLLVKPFHIRFSTTGLNSFFFRLGNAPKLAIFWRVWYGLGVVFGMLAMVLGWALLLFAAIKLILLAASFVLTLLGSSSSIWGSDVAQDHQRGKGSTNRFAKRGLHEEMGSTSSHSGTTSSLGSTNTGDNEMVFVPVIPGVTLPLSHLPYYLIALLVSGVYHEAGHAIAAAREKTQVSTTGIFLYILYPGAFVDISSRALSIMSPLQQLRVICAGVWHNAVMFVAAWIFLSSGAMQLSFRIMGWKHMDDGLSVVNIDPQSPLGAVLKVGSIVRQVDDVSLKGDPLDIWSRTLLPSSTTQDHGADQSALDSGFCIPNTLLFLKPSDCCLFTPEMRFGHAKDESLSCFTPFDPSNGPSIPREDVGDGERVLAKNGQCLPSFDILANPRPNRCTAGKSTCGEGETCYRPFNPYRTASMVRLYCTTPSWELKKPLPDTNSKAGADQTDSSQSVSYDKVVLYQGDPKDIWEAVQVTTMASRWSFLPLWLPNAILLTIRYTMSFSLALAVLNIVPARHLDGHHALKAFAALVQSFQQSYKSTQSVRDSLQECLIDGGSSLSGGGLSSSISTASFAKSSKIVKGIVVSTTVLLGGVMVGSLLQLIGTFIWK
ncbi:Membrane-bound transcription factor site-2 protease [Dissophora globulifera]|nr:Membrane-bound transcription factor site-2 protease [Dissophora globulifera]